MSAVSLRDICSNLCSFLQCCPVFLPIPVGYPVSSTYHPPCSKGHLSVLLALASLGLLNTPLTQKYHLVFCLLDLHGGAKMQSSRSKYYHILQQKQVGWSGLNWKQYLHYNYRGISQNCYLLLGPRQDASSYQVHWLLS